jgi:hypothetical protein
MINHYTTEGTGDMLKVITKAGNESTAAPGDYHVVYTTTLGNTLNLDDIFQNVNLTLMTL